MKINILNKNGFAIYKKIQPDVLYKIIKELGTVIYQTDIKISTNSKRFVLSDKAIGFHTDHIAAKYIVWYCISQSSYGGTTNIIDTKKIISNLTGGDINELSNVMLYEHKVFDSDKQCNPLIQYVNGKCIIYYSFWFINKFDKEKESVKKFNSLISETQKHSFLLQPSDVLIIDNHRMLHGREKIGGNKNRHLKRFWIK